jgi:hypothetical protein
LLLRHRRWSAAAALAALLAVGACRRSAPKPAGAIAVPGPARAATMGAPRARPTGPRGKVISIIYSSNLLGDYEPCG